MHSSHIHGCQPFQWLKIFIPPPKQSQHENQLVLLENLRQPFNQQSLTSLTNQLLATTLATSETKMTDAFTVGLEKSDRRQAKERAEERAEKRERKKKQRKEFKKRREEARSKHTDKRKEKKMKQNKRKSEGTPLNERGKKEEGKKTSGSTKYG